VFTPNPLVGSRLPLEWRRAATEYAAVLLQHRHGGVLWKARFEEKVFYMAKYALESGWCTCKEDEFGHCGICTQRSRLWEAKDFFPHKGLVQFAHFKEKGAHFDPHYKRLSDRMGSSDSPEEFYEWMKEHGQFKYIGCHGKESYSR